MDQAVSNFLIYIPLNQILADPREFEKIIMLFRRIFSRILLNSMIPDRNQHTVIPIYYHPSIS